MAPRRESKDDRHLKPTRRRFSPAPKQRKRSSSVPITGSRKGIKRIEWAEKSKSGSKSSDKTRTDNRPPLAKFYPTRSTVFRRSPGLSPDPERARLECNRETTKNTRAAIGKKGAEVGRSKEKQGMLEVELVKLMGGVRLKSRGRGEIKGGRGDGKESGRQEMDEAVKIKVEDIEDGDVVMEDIDMRD
ncbi:hypothetical protein DL95DRAFT_414344 [Leptodontidium sp. 2 PMI_412]|nr:hypothetical protein DL95DRAFT_414344 [Leptodontidium sp. 2 PMI_412]